MKFIAQEWDYLNEGNANVVLKYTGNDPVLKGKILRLQKTGSECNGRFLIDYQKCLVTRLFGSEFCAASDFVHLDAEFLTQVNDFVKPHRSGERSKNISSQHLQGLLMDDLTSSEYGKGISFELKPKWGFIPEEYGKTCRFCLHNTLKAQSDKSKKSLFCPIKLYSLELPDIYDSLMELKKTPQNNLRIFYNGQLKSVECFCEEDLVGYFHIVSLILRKSEILPILQRSQQKYHDRIMELYDHAKSGRSISDLEYLENLLTNCSSEAEWRIGRYLLSNTLKDISLFIQLNIISENFDIKKLIPQDLLIDMEDKSCGIVKFQNLRIKFKIKMVDVDIKNVKNMSKWFQLEQDLMTIKSKVGKECI